VVSGTLKVRYPTTSSQYPKLPLTPMVTICVNETTKANLLTCSSDINDTNVGPMELPNRH
jgi:hypothetical protein